MADTGKSLDALIAEQKSNHRGRGGRGRGRGRGRGGRRDRDRGDRRGDDRGSPRHSSRGVVTGSDGRWQRGGYNGSPRGGQGMSGTKLLVENLAFSVNEEDIEELFSRLGAMKKHELFYDRNGQSKGSAEIEYFSTISAGKAFNEYNNVVLDGKPMHISFIGGRPSAREIGFVDRVSSRETSMRRDNQRSAGRNSSTKGGAKKDTPKKKEKKEKKPQTKEDLDAELMNFRGVTEESLDDELAAYRGESAEEDHVVEDAPVGDDGANAEDELLGQD